MFHNFLRNLEVECLGSRIIESFSGVRGVSSRSGDLVNAQVGDTGSPLGGALYPRHPLLEVRLNELGVDDVNGVIIGT